MDYKEKYEMALEGIQEILGSGEDSIKMSRLQLRLKGIFPELKEESEDEKIRKRLIERLKCMEVGSPTEIGEEVAWLEKQGELEHTECSKYCVMSNCGNCPHQPVLIEQKSAWSEDEIVRKSITEFFKNYNKNGTFKAIPDVTKWIAWLEESDPRYKYLKELLRADDIYQMAMNDAMAQEAKTKAIDALSKLEISNLLEIEKQGEQKPAKVEPITEGLNTEFQKQVSHLIASSFNREHDYTKGYVEWVAQSLLGYAQNEQKPAENEELTEFDKAVGVSIGTWNPKTPEQIQSVKAVSKKLLKLAKKQINDEQNPAWSEENERLLQIVFDILDKEEHKGNLSHADLKACIRKLKSLKDRVLQQQVQKWSKFDDQMLEAVLYDGENALGERHKEWIKSLKDRVHPKQEWSEEDENELAILRGYIKSGEWSTAHISRALGIIDSIINKMTKK